MTFGVKMTVKNLFFDRAQVVREVGKINAKALSKAGAFVRKKARSLIGQPAKKKTTLPRPAGDPPRARSSDPVRTLRNVLFAYEPENMGVVIGPVLLNGGGGSVPALHEFGGSHPVRHRKWVNGQRVTVVSQGRYPARPFMGPALSAEAPKFPTLWASRGAAA